MDEAAGDLVAQHRLGRSLRDEECRAQIEAEHGVVIVGGDLPERLRPIRAGVVDQDVKGRSFGEKSRHAAMFVHVEDGRVRVRHPGGGHLHLGRRPRDERDRRARLRQRGGGGQPDPPPRPGHQRAPPVEAEGWGGRKRHAVSSGSALPA
jgi:hypothetical protein